MSDDPKAPYRKHDVSLEIQELLAKARARYDAMTPKEKAAHDEAQRQSWVRANKPTGDPRWD